MTEFCDHDQGWEEYDVDEYRDLGCRVVHERCPADDCNIRRYRRENQPTLNSFAGGEARATDDC